MTNSLLARHWHHLPEDEVTELLETDPSNGLDMFAVEHRAEQFGPNAVTVKRGTAQSGDSFSSSISR